MTSAAVGVGTNRCGTNCVSHRSPALIGIINRCFSLYGFPSDFLSNLEIKLSYFPITGRQCIEFIFTISTQHGLCGFGENFESLLMFLCFTVKFHSKYSPFCHPFCRSLYYAAPRRLHSPTSSCAPGVLKLPRPGSIFKLPYRLAGH